MQSLKTLTFTEKQNYLIDCQGYSSEDFEGLGEQGLDNILIDNDFINECIDYNS